MESIKLNKKIVIIVAICILLILIIVILSFSGSKKDVSINTSAPTITPAEMQQSPTKADNSPKASINNISYAYPNNWQVIHQQIVGGGNQVEYVDSFSQDMHQPELTIQVVPENSTQPIDQLAANIKSTFSLTSANTTFHAIPAIQVDGNINLQTMDRKTSFTIYKKFTYFVYKSNVYVIIYSYEVLPNGIYNKAYFEDLLANLQLQ